MAEEFDWYISPAERFASETQFTRYSEDEDYVTIHQLEPLFALSRLSIEEFSQIWQLVDIRMSQKINKEQYVTFAHILNTRRKGKPLPIGVPLEIKEVFLRDTEAVEQKPFTRSLSDNIRDIGSSRHKTTQELTSELSQLETELNAAQSEVALATDRVKEEETTRGEMEGLLGYKRRQLQALREEVQALKGMAGGISGSGGAQQHVEELLEKLLGEKQMLEARKAELERTVAAV
ncbi:hypothetical protein DFS34DRAFT_248525 [Phlyctochytrium arcticum]|nr:hypothetical protein DFS34DRAFT_248525 [Phlyctochytrium arcticum]